MSTLRIEGEAARLIILNCHRLLWRRYTKTPLWSLVSDITGHGSGYSADVCRSANLDPHQIVTKRQPKDLTA